MFVADSTADEVPATGPADTDGQDQGQPEVKPTETVDFWKAKAREQEKRAKDNAAAAKRLAELEDAQKSDAEKVADRIAAAEAEAAAVPGKVAEALRAHLIEIHQISDEDAELFLTGTDPALLRKQVARLVQQQQQAPASRTPRPNPQQGVPSASRPSSRELGLAEAEKRFGATKNN